MTIIHIAKKDTELIEWFPASSGINPMANLYIIKRCIWDWKQYSRKENIKETVQTAANNVNGETTEKLTKWMDETDSSYRMSRSLYLHLK